MRRMRRVLHAVTADAPAEMLSQAAALAGEGDRIVSVGPAPRAECFARDVTPVRATPNVAILLARRMRGPAEGMDLVHAWSASAARAVRAARLPVLVSLPCLGADGELDLLLGGLFDGLWRLTVPTESARKRLVRLGAVEDGIFVLPPSADAVDDAPARRARVREALGLGPSEFLLAAPSEMTLPAGHKAASWTHAMARLFLPQLRLLLPGGGPAEKSVRRFAATTGYDGEVFFTGRRFAMSDVLASADAALFLHERPCGVGALAAAMAARLPIVATACGDIAECAPHPSAALLSPPRDVRAAAANLVRLAETEGLRRRLACEAADRARERFGPGIVRGRLDGIYAQLLARRA